MCNPTVLTVGLRGQDLIWILKSLDCCKSHNYCWVNILFVILQFVLVQLVQTWPPITIFRNIFTCRMYDILDSLHTEFLVVDISFVDISSLPVCRMYDILDSLHTEFLVVDISFVDISSLPVCRMYDILDSLHILCFYFYFHSSSSGWRDQLWSLISQEPGACRSSRSVFLKVN